MMVCVLVAVLLLGGATSGPSAAASPSASPDTSDTTASADASWLVLPYAAYAPDTKIAVGFVVGYYLPSRSGVSPSSVRLTMTVTQRRQLIAQINPELYLSEGRWRVQGELKGSRYPNSFYGIGGDTPSSAEESYTDRFLLIDAVAQRLLRPNLRVGPRVFVRAGSVSDAASGGMIDREAVPGADGSVTVGTGLSAFWDTRDNIYYPTEGTYAQGSVLWHSAAWGSDYTFGRWTADLRGYRSLGPGVMAGQVYTEAVAGKAPFQVLPLLGGDELMRGYREGRFRENLYWALQAEYRFPLFWRFKGTVFGSLGEVAAQVGPDLVNDVEAAVGLGGRFRFTDDGVHGRLDLAYSNTGVELYMSLGEAF